MVMSESQRTRSEPELSGVITVEMAYIIPVILMVFFLCVIGIFYYHDKEIIASCAYEAAVVGSTKAREKDGVTEELVTAVFKDRIRGKCILFSGVQGNSQVSEEMVTVQADAVKGFMKISVAVRADVTEPEKKIRRYRRLGIRH